RTEDVPQGYACASSYVPSSDLTARVPIAQDKAQRERERLSRQIEENRRYLQSIEKKLANQKFVERAPAEVVERERARADEVRATIAALEKNLADLAG
ncbi:MAG TPA: valine--tRNA ligase, partial [Phycisphaerae bacterium]|nr:valine--tRNA ligase [Phycisphaerae bacterium]